MEILKLCQRTQKVTDLSSYSELWEMGREEDIFKIIERQNMRSMADQGILILLPSHVGQHYECLYQ